MMRYVIAIAGVLVVVAGLAGVKGKQIGNLIASGKQFQKMGPPPEAVSTSVAEEQTWEETLSAVGSITTGKGVSIGNDAPGIVSAIHFDSGQMAKQGQVLVELDSRVERAQLASARARRELADTTSKRTRALVASNSVSAAQLDNDESALHGATADMSALEAQIERKIVRAPFAGKLGIRQVNIGQYLNPGTVITVLESSDASFADFTLPQQELEVLKLGMPVRVSLSGTGAGAKTDTADGKITALDPSLDSATRSIKARASIPSNTDWLRPGAFVDVAVILPKQGVVVSIPATAVVHASFGDSVFVVEDEKDEGGEAVKRPDGSQSKVVRQQFVRIGQTRGDFVAITDGVKAGQELVTAGAFKLRNGARVAVNNEMVKQNPQLDPHPANH